MHFVVIYKLYEDKILMMDPAVGKVTMDMFDFTNVWTGYLMLFEKIKSISVITSDKKLMKMIWLVLFNNKSIIVFLTICHY